MGYSASQQASTKQSPYFMMFQQQMRLPIDAGILPQSSPIAINGEDNCLEETIDALLESRNQAFQKAQVNITKAQKQQKETYNRKHLQKELEVGTKVLLENTAQQQRKGGKMEPLRLGPYTINRCLGKGIYELKNMKGEVLKKKANIARLTVFNEQAGPTSSYLPSPVSKGQTKKNKENLTLPIHPPQKTKESKQNPTLPMHPPLQTKEKKKKIKESKQNPTLPMHPPLQTKEKKKKIKESKQNLTLPMHPPLQTKAWKRLESDIPVKPFMVPNLVKGTARIRVAKSNYFQVIIIIIKNYC